MKARMNIVRTTPFIKGEGMRFFRNGCNWGDEKVLLKMGASQERGGGYNNEDAKLLKSL